MSNIKLDRYGKRIDFTDADVKTAIDSFANCQADLRAAFDDAFGKEFTPTEGEYDAAVERAVRWALTDDALETFRDTENIDTPTERASNGRLLDLGAILSDAECNIGDAAREVFREEHPEITVHFRKSSHTYPDGKTITEVFAVFAPVEGMADHEDGEGMLDGYAHIGQHQQMARAYVEESAMATPEEYAPLYKELHDRCGYRMKVAA